MNTSNLGSIYQLTEREVNYVIHDVVEAEKGLRILYCVDSHEVIDFCFPIHLDDVRPVNVDMIADDQAALYEIFYARVTQPILIPEYGKELQRHLSYLQMRANYIYDLVEEIDALKGDGVLDNISEFSRDQILEKMEVQFNNLLAVVMGIHSTGIERLRSVTEDRLQSIDKVNDQTVLSAAKSYSPSPLAKEIFNELVRDKENGRWTEAEIYRKTRAAETDALAVDWLIHMNADLRRAGHDNYLILYLSSAAKTRRIFSLPAVRMAIDRQIGIETPLYRSRAQILARIVSTEPGAPSKVTIENLQQIQSIVGKLASVRGRRPEGCGQCVLDGRTPDFCEFLEVCRGVQRLEIRRQGIQNMGLLGRIQKYEHLLKAQPKKKSHREYIDSFRKLLETENLGDLAIARMRASLSLALTQDQMAAETGRDLDEHTPDGGSISPSHFLPVQPTITDPTYGDIVARIFAYPDLAVQNRNAARIHLHKALNDFEKLDRDCVDTTSEHELVRCLIYMTGRETARDAARGDANALQYAKKMAETRPDLLPEFFYVIIWTARRLGRFQEAHTAANNAINTYLSDPRFYHGRSVNTLSWLEDEKMKVFCPLRIADAIADARRAFALYGQEGSDRTATMAIQLNNIAWMHASVDPAAREYSLSAARETLDELKTLLPRENWTPRFPSFFHTEAHIEFEEYKASFKSMRETSARRIKLKYAEESIEQALSARDTGEFAQLREQIKHEWKSIVRDEAREQTKQI